MQKAKIAATRASRGDWMARIVSCDQRLAGEDGGGRVLASGAGVTSHLSLAPSGAAQRV